MHDTATLSYPAEASAPRWTALVTDDGPFAAFVRGHQDLFLLAADAYEAIIDAFDDLSPDYGRDIAEILEAAGGAVLRHDWMRHTESDGEIDYFEFCSPAAKDAFPVTAARFQ